MKTYDKIEYWNRGPFGENTIAFFKNDGSNLRFEFSKNKGWYKFGTRNTMISKDDSTFGNGVNIFLNKYEDDIPRIIEKKYRQMDNFVVFCEYFGPNSFAGWHDTNDKMDIVLFDISLYKKGIINPYEFIDNFSSIDIPDVIYEGEYNMELVNNVRNNTYGLVEGVVCKGLIKTKKQKEQIWMTKVKTDSWIFKVKDKFGEKYLLTELNNDKSLLI